MIITTIISILFSVFSTAIMGYIAMATSTGPWIEPTLVLLGTVVFRFMLARVMPVAQAQHAIGYSTAAGAIGGITAIACGWAFPTLYFLDKNIFTLWISNPYYFSAILTATVLTGGFLGFFIAHVFEHHLYKQKDITFPIGDLVHSMIFAQDQVRQTIELMFGGALALFVTITQKYSTFIPSKITLIPTIAYGILKIPSVYVRCDLLPIFLSIGFITGHLIALPLLFGFISKIFLIEPLQRYFFATITTEGFLLAFVSGMVIQGAIITLFDLPRLISTTTQQIKNYYTPYFSTITFTQAPSAALTAMQQIRLNAFFEHMGTISVIFGAIPLYLFLSFFKFSLLAQLYIVIFTAVCTYQLLMIAGKTGLAPFPRFATFVLIPGMLMFGFDAIQITIVSTFVEVCCGVAVDVLFGRKMAKLAHMEKNTIVFYQLLGLLVSALSIGVIFYFLINHFGLGTPELFAQRAHARALLVKTKDFNYIVMILGAVFSYSLKFIKINPLLVMGGLLMPPELSLSLIFGGLLTYVVKNKERYYPFWSGVFAASSFWMVLRTIL
jgi:hypothetical protein